MLTRDEIRASLSRLPDLSQDIAESFLLNWLEQTAPSTPVALEYSYLYESPPGLKAIYQIGDQEVVLRIHGLRDAPDEWFAWQLTRKTTDEKYIQAAMGSPLMGDALITFNLWLQQFATRAVRPRKG